LLTLQNFDGSMSFLAVSVKPEEPPKGAARSKELLSLEREYWIRRGVPWLLFTPDLYDSLVAEKLRGTSHWALSDQYDSALLAWMVTEKNNLHYKTLTQIFNQLVVRCGGNMHVAQCTLWRGIWKGMITFDLRRSWRPSAPLILQSAEAFWERNPIVSRRSSWQT
jgi:hypothetical protein